MDNKSNRKFTKEHNDLNWLFPQIQGSYTEFGESAFDSYERHANNLLESAHGSEETFTRDDVIDAFMKGASVANQMIGFGISQYYNTHKENARAIGNPHLKKVWVLHQQITSGHIVTIFSESSCFETKELAEKVKEFLENENSNSELNFNNSYTIEEALIFTDESEVPCLCNDKNGEE